MACLIGGLIGISVAQIIIWYLESRPPTATVIHSRRMPDGRWVQEIHRVPVTVHPDGRWEWSWRIPPD